MKDIIDKEQVGAVVWWELSGICKIDELRTALEDEGLLDPVWLPRAPSLEIALYRAARCQMNGRDVLVRSTGKRGSWEAFVEERIEGRVELTSIATGRVERDGNGAERVAMNATNDEHSEEYASKVLAGLEEQRDTLLPDDVSRWLINVVSNRWVGGVSLRDRGGFYFVPRGGLSFWRAIENVVHATSEHLLHSLPIMRTDECALAVLDAVRRETDAVFTVIEDYLSVVDPNELSTRGLNSAERRLEKARKKMAAYTELFGGNSEILGYLRHQATGLEETLASCRLSRVRRKESLQVGDRDA